MTMRERFTDEEWHLVAHIPFDAFIFGAAADGNIEEAEVKAFVETLEKAPFLNDPLHKEIALDYVTSGVARIGEEMKFEMAESATAMKARMDRTKLILLGKLSRPEYQSFFKSVWISAMAVAGASTQKTHFWEKKKPISEKEAAGLAAFALAWEVDVSFLKGT